jgi:ectoine hydroxylase-related dioxygenase (phytanoyl-CoA dioxygenase family)
VRGVLDDLLGEGAWPPPRDWGRPLVTFPEPGTWDVPAGQWHWDSPCELHIDRLRGLFVVSFISSVARQGGGTLILAGSPRLLIEQQRQFPASERHESITRLRDRFKRSHPWLKGLSGLAPSPPDRIAAYMDRETVIDGVPLRVVELTGEPGDMVFCHPAIVHSVAPNRGSRPRFMRIKTQILTDEGRELRDRPERPIV